MIQAAASLTSPSPAWQTPAVYRPASASVANVRHLGAFGTTVRSSPARMMAPGLLRGTSSASSRREVAVVSITRLITKVLTKPLAILVERDGQGYIARCPDLPNSYAYEDNQIDAVETFKHEVEMLHEELHETADLSAEWRRCRDFLDGLLANGGAE